MTTRFVRLAAGLAAISLLAAACGDDSNDSNTDATDAPVEATTAMTEAPEMTAPATTEAEMTEEADIVDTAIAAGDFTTLVAAVQAAGLEETLRGEGPFTVFAPTDEAFAALPAGTVDTLLEDPTGDLAAILTYHVVAGEVLAADVVGLDGQEVATVNGATFTVNVADDGSVSLTDAAGNEVGVVATDIQASNGVIHVIDAVLMPTAGEEPEMTAPATTEAEMTEEADIVDTAIAAGDFTTLVAAVQAAGLEETLRGEGPFTVFAPTDDAFAALPAGTVDTLLEDPTGDLAAILTYHVVAGEVLAADVVGLDGQEVATVNGATFTVNVADDGSVSLTDAAGNEVGVVATDIQTSNGVIHVIDAVLMPG